MTYYSQLDKRWSGQFIGKTKQTLKLYGCVVTSLSNLLNTVGYDETPETVNNKLTKAGGYVGALVIWSKVSQIWNRLKFVKRVRNYNNAEVAYYVYIKKTPVLCEVYNPLSPTRLHWVLLIGNRQLVDPLGGVVKPTSTFKTYTGYTIYDK